MAKAAIHKQLTEDLLLKVSEATSGMVGHDFILELSQKIPSILEMRYCFVAEYINEEKTRLRTIAFSDGKKLLDNIEYNISDSAWQRMMDGDPYFLPAGTLEIYQAAKGIEAYVGAPILSPATGEVLGHIAVTDPNPVSDEKNYTAVLKIFASRIGAEMERIKA